MVTSFNPVGVAYRAHVLRSKDQVEVADLLLQTRELFRVEDLGLTNKTNTAEWERHIIRFGKSVFFLKKSVQVLMDGRVSSIGADEDVALIS